MKIGGNSISDDAVYDIKEDEQGRIWVATFGDGVKCCPNPMDSNPVLSEAFGFGKVRRLLITPSNNMIAATTDGLLIGHIDSCDYRKTRLQMIKRDGDNPNSLSSNSLMSVAMTSDGTVFICTESSGVDMIRESCLFSSEPEFIHLNVRNSSLTSDICNAMALISDSLLMIVSNNRVMALNPMTRQTVNLGSVFWGDSCRFSEADPVMTSDSALVFGTKKALILRHAMI